MVSVEDCYLGVKPNKSQLDLAVDQIMAAGQDNDRERVKWWIERLMFAVRGDDPAWELDERDLAEEHRRDGHRPEMGGRRLDCPLCVLDMSDEEWDATHPDVLVAQVVETERGALAVLSAELREGEGGGEPMTAIEAAVGETVELVATEDQSEPNKPRRRRREA